MRSSQVKFDKCTQIIQDHQEKTKQEIKIACPFMKKSVMICMNNKCISNAFICADQKCQCIKQHLKCMKLDTDSFTQNLCKRDPNIETIETFIDDQIQKMIDFLSDFRDKTILQLKQQFEYFGMGQNQKQLLRKMKLGKFQSIIGSKIWSIVQNQQQKELIKQFIDQSLIEIQNNFKKSTLFLEQVFSKVTQQIQACNQKAEKYFNPKSIESLIVTTKKDFKTLQSFFAPNKMKLKKLLYRASDNDFEVRKFHEKCDGIQDTVLLIETEFGKKIGGYTLIAWDIHGGSKKDLSMESFIFSLTHGQKFEMKNEEYAVCHNIEYGPLFGGGSDIFICNKGNQTSHSYANIGNTYVNNNYKYQDKESWKRFCGNQNSYNFLVKQWEVWKVEFD